MIRYGRIIKILIIIIIVDTACNQASEENKYRYEPQLVLSYLFKDGNDTISMGDETDLTIKIEEHLYDSISVIIGNVENNSLIDTAGILPVKNNFASITFIPNKRGIGKIQGIIQDIKIEEERLIIKTVPFEIKYYVK